MKNEELKLTYPAIGSKNLQVHKNSKLLYIIIGIIGVRTSTFREIVIRRDLSIQAILTIVFSLTIFTLTINYPMFNPLIFSLENYMVIVLESIRNIFLFLLVSFFVLYFDKEMVDKQDDIMLMGKFYVLSFSSVYFLVFSLAQLVLRVMGFWSSDVYSIVILYLLFMIYLTLHRIMGMKVWGLILIIIGLIIIFLIVYLIFITVLGLFIW